MNNIQGQNEGLLVSVGIEAHQNSNVDQCQGIENLIRNEISMVKNIITTLPRLIGFFVCFINFVFFQ